MSNKKRLDVLVQAQLTNVSRAWASHLIEQGLVKVNGQVLTKPGAQIEPNSIITVDYLEPKYVSRAGFKLEQALQDFKIDVIGKIVLDSGLSTGGFTDCLLQHGAAKVYGVDVGRGQVHPKISADPQVVVMEQTNLRTLERLPELVDLATLDLSFISVLKVIESVAKLIKVGGRLVVLIKPQFEVGKDLVGSGGIVKDLVAARQAVDCVISGIEQVGFCFKKVVPSSTKGGDGNQEYLAWFIKT